MMKRLLAMLVLAGCAQPTTEIPNSQPSIAGRITHIDRSGDATARIRVEERPGEQSGSAKAVAAVTAETRVITGSGAADHNALVVGQWVRVWFTGPVAESYPVQARAATVVVDSTAR